MGLTEHLWYVYGPLKGRMARYIVHSTDRKLSDNRHRQITPDYRRLPMLRYRWKTVENCGGTWWTHVTCQILPYSARVVKSTNYDFPCPARKIAIGSLSTSALAALKTLTYN